MTATLKTSKRASYSTFLDVINENENISTEVIDQSSQGVPSIIKHVGNIETSIYRADSMIDGYLRRFYSIPTGFDTVSWATLPIAGRGNSLNSITAPRLGSVFVNNTSSVDPRTAVWKITFDSVSSFSLFSYLESNQGTGVTGTDATSTNGDVTILAAAWETTTSITSGDKFYFSIIDVFPLINLISTKLATSMILSSIYSEQSPNDSEQAVRLWREAMGLLNRLQKPFEPDGLRLSEYSAQDVSSISVAYKVDDTGYDQSPYLDLDDTNGEYP